MSFQTRSKSYTSNQTAKFISDNHDHILIYAKNENFLSINKIKRTQEQKEKFSNPDNDPRGPWKAENLSSGKFYSLGQFEIIGPTGLSFYPPKNRYWRCNEEKYKMWLRECPAYTLLYKFSPKDTGKSKVK